MTEEIKIGDTVEFIDERYEPSYDLDLKVGNRYVVESVDLYGRKRKATLLKLKGLTCRYLIKRFKKIEES